LILNKKSISNYEQQLFQQELEKYRPYQNRLVQATHKQAALMRELTVAFNGLLQDKRVRAEQSKYESFQRQRGAVINKYKRAYQEFLDLEAGLQSAKTWYMEMRETVESLEKNVETFVNNRRAEGAQLLNQIEQDRAASKNAHSAMEQERIRGLMERMSMEPPSTSPQPASSRPTPAPLSFNSGSMYPKTNFSGSGQYQLPSSPPPTQTTAPQSYLQQQGQSFTYNPSSHGRIPGPASPPPTQTGFNIGTTMRGPASPPPTQTSFGHQPGRYSTYGNPAAMQQQQQQPQQHQQQHQHQPAPQQHPNQPQHQQHASYGSIPPNFVPPPPPPGPPPLGPQQMVHYGSEYYTGDPNAGRPGSAQQQQHHQQQHGMHMQAQAQGMGMGQGHAGQGQGQGGQGGQDPWAGLSAWK
jgi:hypothetical protein